MTVTTGLTLVLMSLTTTIPKDSWDYFQQFQNSSGRIVLCLSQLTGFQELWGEGKDNKIVYVVCHFASFYLSPWVFNTVNSV